MSVLVEPPVVSIPSYHFIQRLGRGSFGEVWKALAPDGQAKAVKLVHGDLFAPEEESQQARREFKGLLHVLTIHHPHLLTLEGYEIIDGCLVIVMELAEGNLWQRFRACRTQGLPGIPRGELLEYLTETAAALDEMNLHHHLQHLDIKPSNLLLVDGHVKVADFGMVKDLAGLPCILTGGITPAYGAPETVDGWVSPSCDQYSLAIVYQELLTGWRPFDAPTVGKLLQQHLWGVPNLAPLPTQDREAVRRALAKHPDDRHACCLDLMTALRRSTGAATGSLAAALTVG